MPEGLAAILDRLLAKDPADRFATPAEVAEAIAPWCVGADLPALLQRALEAKQSPLPPGEGQGEGGAVAGQPTAAPPLLLTAWGWKWFAGQLLLLLLVGGLGFALGITIHIQKDGKVTAIEVPEGSKSRVAADGQLDVTLPPAAEYEYRGRETRHIVTEGQIEWTMHRRAKSPVQARQSEESPLQFGPVSERVVNALGEGKGGEALDLAGGKLVDVPKEFTQWFPQQQEKWSAENNVDLVVEPFHRREER